MKQINDLIVVEVPKGSRNHQMLDIGVAKYCQWDIGLATGVDKLPPGQYEIIGLYSEVTELMASRMLQMHGIILPADYEPISAFHGQIKRIYDMHPTDTTDLLFIHKLK